MTVPQAPLSRTALHPLVDVGRLLRANGGGPVTYCLAGDAWTAPHVLGDRNLVIHTIGASPSRHRVLITHVLPDAEGILATEIAVWDTRPLRLTHQLVSRHFAQLVPYDHPPPGDRKNLEAVCFAGEDHLAVGLCDGGLQIYALTGELVAEALLGGSIGELACSDTHLAVSLYPGPPHARQYECCGIKELSLERLLAGEVAATDFISGRELGFIPHTLQYDAGGTRLVCLGASSHGRRTTNKAVVLDTATGEMRHLLREDDDEIAHAISPLASDGASALVGRRHILWLDRDLRPIAQRRRPTSLAGLRVPCLLAAQGGPLFLRKRGGIHVYRSDRGRARYVPGPGRAELLAFRPDGALVLLVHQDDTYQLAAFDPETLELVEHSEPSTGIETIPTHGYDCAGDGTLAVADRSGSIRLFDWHKATARRVSSDCGPVCQILADRSHDRFGVLSCSGAIRILDSTATTLRPYVASFSGKSVDAPDTYHRISLARYQHPNYFLFFSESTNRVWAFVDGQRGVRMRAQDGSELTIEERDWGESRWNTLARFSLETPAVAGDVLGDRVALVLADGSLAVLDPYHYCLRTEGYRKVLAYDGVHAVHISTSGIALAQGLCVLGDRALAIRSRDGVALVQLDDEYGIVRQRQHAVRGVRNIKWDQARNRLLVLMDSHLSVWSLELEELFNLYLLPEGHFLLHVPYPSVLRVDGVDHPGYFWSEHPEPFAFWEVLDARGNVVRSEKERAAYLRSYCNRILVERAMNDYERFVHDLRGAREVKLPPPRRLLPFAGSRRGAG